MQDKQKKKRVLMQYLQGSAAALTITTVFALAPFNMEALNVTSPVPTETISSRLTRVREQFLQGTDHTNKSKQTEPLPTLAQGWFNWSNYMPWNNWNNWSNWGNWWRNW